MNEEIALTSEITTVKNLTSLSTTEVELTSEKSDNINVETIVEYETHGAAAEITRAWMRVMRAIDDLLSSQPGKLTAPLAETTDSFERRMT